MIIKSKRVTLEPATLNHLETTYKYFSDLENTSFTYYLPMTYNQTYEYLKKSEDSWNKESPRDYEFVIIYGSRNIGIIGLEIYDNNVGEIWWILDKLFQHQGFAYEAALAIIDFAKQLRLSTIIAHCDTRNVPSFKLMEKIGMVQISQGIRKYLDKRGIAKEYIYELKLEKGEKICQQQ